MAAFEAAMRVGAEGVELDVRLCASGELIVFHDDSLERLCGDPRKVASLAWRDLRGCRVEGYAIPALAEVFAAFPNALVNVELKTHPLKLALPLAQATIAAVRDARAIGRCLVSSFDPRLLAIMRVLAPEVPRGLLYARTQGLLLRSGILATPLGATALHPQHDLVDEEAMAQCVARGMRMHVWTVDDLDRISYLANLGVHALICNDPGAALAALAD